MSDRTGIEWTRGDDGTPGATWNPVTGCEEVSEGCDHCYAKTFAERWRGIPGHHFERGFDLTLRPERLGQPLKWKKPRRIFVNSMSDLFHKDVPDEFIARVFAVMAITPRHTYQVLTKRHGRMRSLLSSDEFRLLTKAAHHEMQLSGAVSYSPLVINVWPPKNVWLGVSVENQKWADIRIPALLETPAAVRFLSCEPLLGPVDLRAAYRQVVGAEGDGPPLADVLHWVICGGESGPGARPMHPDWARSLRDQCTAAGVPFFLKQWGEWAPHNVARPTYSQLELHGTHWDGTDSAMARVGKKTAGRVLDGQTWDEFPEAVSR